MNFIHNDLGYRQGGETVEVTLSGSAANVRLLDSSNFSSYRSGRRHSYRGGLVTRSPYRLSIPHSGHWHVTIDMAGLRGNVRASTRILPGALPAASEAPLASVPTLLPPDDSPREFDVFISHASEDKDALVRPLAVALQGHGLRVWYDEFELRIGSSLRREIDRGLARSRFGIVVLSRPFLTKGWTNYELDGIITKANSGEQVVLPIWHNITKQEVLDYSPSLADKVARNTSSYTIAEIAAEIAELITSTSPRS